MNGVLLRNADLGLARPSDIRIAGGVVRPDENDDRTEGIDCAGAAVLPGLHDHHVHLLAAAAALDSVECGPPEVSRPAELTAALRGAAPRHGWVRGVGYDDALGPLDRSVLDRIRADVPVRVQHRGGSLWVLNSAALAAVGAADARLDGVQCDAAGNPTGRLWRLDGWLRDRLGPGEPPDLAALSARLASFGITGVTDATPDLPAATVRLLRSAVVAQRVTLLGDPAAPTPWKIVVSDHELPAFDDLVARIRAVRPRAVALHCVTRLALVLILAALREARVRPGDRIEHAAVCSPDLAGELAQLGVTVVTQPSLVARRGDEYLDRVDATDRPALWPFASLLRAGVRVGCSSDAPYGDFDPWHTIAAAVHRAAPSGRVVCARERVTAEIALARFLTPPADPGGTPRRVAPGGPADLVVLDRPLADALRSPEEVRVRHTLIDGRLVYSTDLVAA